MPFVRLYLPAHSYQAGFSFCHKIILDIHGLTSLQVSANKEPGISGHSYQLSLFFVSLPPYHLPDFRSGPIGITNQT
jgi:hypothetical protein